MAINREISQFSNFISVDDSTRKVSISTSFDISGTLEVSSDVNVVGVLTAERLHSNVFGEFTGGGITGTNITGTALNISGLSTFTGNIDANGDLDVDGHTELDNLNVSGVSTFQDNVDLGDDDRLRFGDSNDLEIFHNGTNSVIKDSGTGNLFFISNAYSFRNADDNEQLATFTQNASVDLYYNNSKKFETTGAGVTVYGTTETQQLNVSGVSTFQSHVHLGDDDELRFGASNDFKIVHDPNDCRFENSNGDIKFKNTGSYFFFDEDGGETLASFINDGAVNLYHAGSKKLETTGYGVTVFGTIQVSNDVNVVGVLTAERLYSNVYGEFTGGGITGTNITGTALNISGLSTFQSHVHLGDDDKLRFGDSNDLEIFHNGTNSVIKDSGTGNLFFISNSYSFRNAADNEQIAIFTENSSVDLYYNNSKKFETTASGIDITGHTETDTLNVSGISTFTGDVSFGSTVTFGDNDQIIMGDGPDLKLYHDGSNSYVEDTGTGALIMKGSTVRFRSTTNENMLSASQNGAISLYHDNNVKFETTASGIDVTGHTETDTLNVSGITTVNSLQVETFSTFNGNTKHFDGKYANFGNSNDLQIVHDGSNAVIQNATGQIFFDNNASGGDIFLRANDNVVIRIDGNDTVLTAQTGGIDVTGHTETDTLNVSGISTLGTLQVSNNVNVVGVLTAERLYSNVYGEFTGGGISGTNIVGTSLSISGISTLGTLQISSGIVTATSGIITYYGDGSNLTGIGTNFNGASKSVVKYVATDGQTTFVASYELGYVDVYLNGVKLTADLYTSTSGTSIVLNDGAAANDVIEIISFTFIEPSEADSANNIANKASSKYTATNGQTSFAATYEIGYVDVYLNGVKLTDDLYDATSGSAVILNDGAAAGDIVEIIAFTFHNFNVGIQSGGSLVGSAKTINFNGSGISSVTVSSGIATINIEGSSSGINPIVANIVF